jgi:hypothetical protein
LFRSVQVGCSRFSRRCHLIVDLDSIITMEVGHAIDTVTELGFGLCFSFLGRFGLYAATGIAAL